MPMLSSLRGDIEKERGELQIENWFGSWSNTFIIILSPRLHRHSRKSSS